MNIITGYRGEPHITAQEDRDINLGLVGKSTTDVYVFDVGQKLSADIVSANEVRVRDGVIVMQGCAASIDYGTYDSLTISNGSQGMKRIDVIAAQYEKDGDTNVESLTLVVIEGTPDVSDPQVPSLTSGSIQDGDSLVQMQLYYVNIDGVSIDSLEAQFKYASNVTASSVIEYGSNSGWYYEKYSNGKVIAYYDGRIYYSATSQSGSLYRSSDNAQEIPAGIFDYTPQFGFVTLHASSTVVVNVTVIPTSTTSYDAQVWRSTNASSSANINVSLCLIYMP